MMTRKTSFILIILIAFMPFFLLCQEGKKATPNDGKKITLDSQNKKCSYAAGYDFGANFLKRYKDIDIESVVKGLKDAIAESKPMMTEDERIEALMILGTQMKEHLSTELKKLALQNKEEGEKFLDENAKKPGIIKTPSGLQYKIIKEGTGEQPTINDKVLVHYKGMLTDGTVFDNTHIKNEPIEFFMENLIPAWKEALQLMKEGSKWEIYAPPELAYGDKDYNEIIGPSATLIFELELIKIIKKP